MAVVTPRMLAVLQTVLMIFLDKRYKLYQGWLMLPNTTCILLTDCKRVEQSSKLLSLHCT